MCRQTLCIERTTLKLSNKLPGILRWFEVTHSSSVTLSPIENAIDAVTNKNEQIRALMAEYEASAPDNINPLTMLLNGTIDAAVQGGLKKYEQMRASLARSAAVRQWMGRCASVCGG